MQAIGQILKVGQRRSIRHAQSDTENRKLPAASHWKWGGINLDGAPLSNWVPQVLHSSTICRGRNGTFHKRLRTHWHTAQLTWQKMERHTEHTKPNSMALCSRWAMCQPHLAAKHWDSATSIPCGKNKRL